MKPYIAVVESKKRKGRVKLAIHAYGQALAIRRFTSWTVRTLRLAPGEKCIAFQDAFPA